jgi:hypothetical protein
VVQEVERGWQRQAASTEIVACIREAITNEHDIAVHKVALIPIGTLPQTTSGKIQRHLARQLWLAGALATLDQPLPRGPATTGTARDASGPT